MIIQDEIDAIDLCRRHKEEGLAWLIHHHQIHALKIAYLMTGDYASAEDIVQDSFVQVWKSIHSFHPQSSFAPWFMRIVINMARMYQRSHSRHPVMRLDQIDSQDADAVLQSTDPVTMSEQSELHREMLQALAILTDLQREAVILHYYGGYSAPDIAQIVGGRPDAVRRRIHDGLIALERVIERRYSWLKETYR